MFPPKMFILIIASICKVVICSEINSEGLINVIDASRIAEHVRYLSSKPHIAGSKQNDEFAWYIYEQWQNQGLDEVKNVFYDVLLSFPHWHDYNKVNVINELTNEVIFASSVKEEPLSQPEESDPNAIPNYSAFSANGNVQGHLVYVNYGSRQDFEWIKNAGIDLAGKIAIARNGKSWRGLIVMFAQMYGAIGLILYSDPKDYAPNGRSDVYPNSAWMPGTATQKGTLRNDYGDQLTPNYPATQGAFRIPMSEINGLKIVVQPISYNDAEQILKNMGGPNPPEEWIGSLNVSYKVGPGYTDSKHKVAIEVNNQQNITKITNVIGYIRGSAEPDRYIILGSHRDAWTFGAADPASATSAMLEVSRVLGEKVRNGWRPRRTIIFASWDAEEQAIIGSTEWVEENLKVLQNRAVIYLNAEIAAAGCDTIAISGYPMTARMLFEVAKKVPNPNWNESSEGLKTVYDQWQQKFPPTQFSLSTSQEPLPSLQILKAGSDFSSFAFQAGVTSVDNTYARLEVAGKRLARYALYHTKYDTYYNYATFIDPGFNCSKAIAQMWAEEVYVMAESVFLPFNVSDYASYILFSIQQISNKYGAILNEHSINTEYLETAGQIFAKAAQHFQDQLIIINPNDALQVRMSNDKLMQVDRAFLKENRKQGQPNIKHVVFGPDSSEGFPDIVNSISSARTPEDWQNVKQVISIILEELASLLLQT